MQRKRSYVEAMETAGSLQDLLKARNASVDSAPNQNASVNTCSDYKENIKNRTNNNDQINNSKETWSNDSVFEDNDIDLRSKSQYFDNYNSSDRNTVVPVNRNFVSENDVTSTGVPATGTIMDYKNNSEISDNSNVSRGLSIVDELINEPLNARLYRSAPNITKKSLQHLASNQNTLTKEGQELNNYNRIDYDNNAHAEDVTILENLSPDEHVELRGDHDNAYPEDDPQFYEDKELNYDSDDMILDYDDGDVEHGHARHSLTIPNTVTSDDNSVLPILYTGRNSARKPRKKPENLGNRSKRVKRLIFKNGDTNIPLRQNLPSKMGKFMKDIVTTLIECQWRWITLIFSMGHFLLWFIFGLMFYVAALSNGDMLDDPPKIPCIENARTFTAIFGFSVETQVSIGYGQKSPTEECPEVIFILLMEVIAGYALLGALVGIVYAKIARPEKKIEGVGFSKHAVICMRDGQLCLVVRVWDTQGKHVIGTRVSAYLVNHNIPNSAPLVLEQQNPIIMWPTTLQHNIVEGSPLYDTSAKDLIDQRFEIVFSITGSSRVTGQMAQSRTSYLPHNILWGQRFINILSYNREQGSYLIDQKSLNAVKAVDTPLCSARLLDQVTEQGPSSPFFLSTPSSPSTLTSPGWSFRREYKPNTMIKRLLNN